MGKRETRKLFAYARLAGLSCLACLSAIAPASAQTVDFEASAYIADKSIVNVDGWTAANGADNFKTQAGSENKWVHNLTNSNAVTYRIFPEKIGLLDLRWRWRATDDGAYLCLGVAGNTTNVRLLYRAMACMDPLGGIEGQGLIASSSDQKWVKNSWHYMHMIMDPSANKYILYMTFDSLRANEHIAVNWSDMNGVGLLSRIFISTENGNGAVDIDDLSWENLAYWMGDADTLWSTGNNWSTSKVPDSLTHVIFSDGSTKNCFVDKHAAVKSITVLTGWKGSLNLGTSTLTILDKADLTGGTYPYQPTGLLRFIALKGQSLTGAEGGKNAPPIRHDGSGTLRLDTRNLFASNFSQIQGNLDFNGQNIIALGTFNIKNGRPGTLKNLDGRSISVGVSAHFEGVSKDTLLGLVSVPTGGGATQGWTAGATLADSLVAKFASIGNGRTSGASGLAFQCNDAGNNLGWIFVAPPTIIAQPKDVNIKITEDATFKVSATSKLAITYQWLRNDQDIPGAKDSLYILRGVKLADSGVAFTCRVSTIGGNVTSATARLKVDFPAPTIQPAPKEFSDSLAVKISPSITGAKTFYSLNGSVYLEFPPVYLMLKDSALLRAYSVLDRDTSAVGSWKYPKFQLPMAETPVLSPGPQTFLDSLVVNMSAATAGSVIYYTLDQSDPDSTKTRYTGPFSVHVTTTVSARAIAKGYRPSTILINIYMLKNTDTTANLSRPKANPPGGSFGDTLSVTLTPPTSAPNATIYYTFENSPLLKYYSPITLREPGVLKAIAISGSTMSDTAIFTFTRKLEAPSATPKGRNFPDTLLIALASKIVGTSIYYTWDGSDPTAKSKLYPGVPIFLDSSATLKAIAIKDAETSVILAETYHLVADTPQASHRGGDYSSKIQIALTASTKRAILYYTLDGTTPGPESGRQPYSSPISLDTTATLKAVAITGHGLTTQRSPMLVVNYTFIMPGRRILGPGQKIDISSNYNLTSSASGASPVIVDILKSDSLAALKGFRDIQFAMRLSLPEGSTVFPRVVFAAPTGEPRALYGLVPPTTVHYITDADAQEIVSAGTYFLAIDTLAPQITLSGESFVTDDSTKSVFSIQDNVTNLLLDLDRTDIPARNIVGKLINSPDITIAVLRNPSGSILPLTVKLKVDDHHQSASFPPNPGSFHFLAQKNTGPVQTPAMLKLGTSTANPWDLITLPISVDPPLTIAQLRKYNSVSGMAGATWDALGSKYRFLKDDEAITPGASIWLGSPMNMTSLTFPSLQTIPRTETGGYRITLHKGWNQVANPTLMTLYWPVTRALPSVYDLSLLKGLHGYDATSQNYVHVDSLVPWRGYFAYYEGGRDTVIELRFQPVPAAPVAAAKSAADAGISITLNLAQSPALRLGASASAQDGLSYEDEVHPPTQGAGGIRFWSMRDKRYLETDLQHWVPGALYTWRLVAQVPAGGNSLATPVIVPDAPVQESTAAVGTLILPDGYAAWAVSRTRGLRFHLSEGTGIPMYPGLTDSLEILAGPSAEVEARVASIPLSVPTFQLYLFPMPGGFILNLRLPQAAHIRWTLWSIDGKARKSASLNLPEGVYHLPGITGPRLMTGIYVLAVEWTGTGGRTANSQSKANLSGRITRKIAIP